MVSWFAQTAKELFRHLAFFKDNLSGMRGEVFLYPFYLFVHLRVDVPIFLEDFLQFELDQFQD